METWRTTFEWMKGGGGGPLWRVLGEVDAGSMHCTHGERSALGAQPMYICSTECLLMLSCRDAGARPSNGLLARKSNSRELTRQTRPDLTVQT